MPHVTGTGVDKERLRRLPDDPAEDLEQVEQAVAVAAGDVERPAAHDLGGCARSREVGADRIVDEGEVAALEAVSVHGGVRAAAQGVDEERDDSRVGGVRTLARAEDVEVAERHRLEAVQLGVDAAVELAGELRDGVGRPWDGGGRLRCRQVGGAAVDAARRGADDPAHPRLPGQLEDGQRAVDVGEVGGERALDRAEHRAVGRLVEDDVGTLEALAHDRLVGDVPDDEACGFAHVLTGPSREVVEDTHLVAACQKGVDQVRADEAGPTGHDGRHRQDRPATVSPARVAATPNCLMDLPPLTYLCFDSLEEGVGASQVTPYLERLAARGLQVTLHTFEKQEPSPDTRRRLDAAGVAWRPHPFGSYGSRGGATRVVRAARYVRGAELLHARSDLAAASALLARPRAWLWDRRSLWAEERVELGMLHPSSPEYRLLQLVGRKAATRAGAIVTLAQALVPVMAERYGAGVVDKISVVPTCVDLARFRFVPPAADGRVRLLLSGTLNGRYDVPAMIRLTERVRRLRPTDLQVLAPGPSPWDRELRAAGGSFGSAHPGEMPERTAMSSAGLSLVVEGSTPAAKGSMPTKLGEFLACGRPVVTSSHLGDMEDLLARFDCGVALSDTTDTALDAGAEKLVHLLDDPGTPERCRALAEEHFDVEKAAETLVNAYARACSGAMA